MKDLSAEKKQNKNVYGAGVKAAVFGIASNVLLFAAKLTVGLLMRSITVAADAVNNLSDGASSVITVVGYKISARPADKKHPYGHARFEYVAALVISVVMLVIGAMFLKESLTAIFSPKETATVGVYAYFVLGGAIAVKGAQAAIYLRTYKKTNSLPMKAAAADSVGDVASTFAALISTIVIDVAGYNADGYFGAAISIFILFSAVRVLKDSVNPLLGDAPSADTLKRIEEKILSYDGVLGVHDIVLHSYGAAYTFAIAHVEVSADQTLSVAHELIDRIEREVSAEMGIMLVAHIDPIADDFASAGAMKEEILAFLSERFSVTALHDFRVVKRGGSFAVCFDVEIPWEAKTDASQIENALRADYNPDFSYSVNLDRR